MSAQPAPSARRQALTPYLIVKDAAKAIDFYVAAFGAVEQYRLDGPDGRIGHAELQVEDSYFMIADEYPDFGAMSPVSIGGTPVSLHLSVADVDAAVARAAAAGGTILRAPKDEFYGDRAGMIADPFGHKWHLATTKQDVSPAEMQTRWNAMSS